MPAAKISRDDALDRITEVFRRWGYDGTTLRLLSDATGLGRASLYHHFPGGKEEMAEAVFGRIGERVAAYCVAPLRAEGTPRERLERHAAGLSRLYDGGKSNCLFGAMVLGGGLDRFGAEIKGAMRQWIGALAEVAREAGVPAADARRSAERAVVEVQGALIVSRGLGSAAPFKKVIEQLPDTVLGSA